MPETWTPLPNLLDSGPFDQSFVVETDNDGTSSLRFGDDQYGRRPYGAERVIVFSQRMGTEIADGKGLEWITRVAPVVERGQKV